MSLILCTKCLQHHMVGQVCPACTKRHPSGVLPLAILLGIGCQKPQTEPEVMALYGGPPVEDVEVQSDDTNVETQQDERVESEEPFKIDQSNGDKAVQQEIRPEREIMALYGGPPVEPVRIERLEKEPTDESDIDESSNADSELDNEG